MTFLLYTRLRVLLHCFLIAICTQCGPTVSEEKVQGINRLPGDTLEVTSFNIERKESPALANWSVFESGQEIICVPPAWASHLEDDGQELVLLPPDTPDSTERVTFTRWAKDSPTLDYPSLAYKLVKTAFPGFQQAKVDTVTKLIFQHDFGIERSVGLRAKGRKYNGFCLAYVDDSNVYQFRIILEKNRLSAYKGNLMSDIIGNLQINKQYFMGNANPLKQAVNLR
ncbi:hypothetical protein [Hymenobacter perfusus]|uniref:DUF1795 domain-containing protein n=1 Tax=Hymenobacter perfusus TaxID=1236770 RepID=A0A428JWE0_9BACT|nr:hypothetical protein [Hymenobacter perfusus]RSK38438.1 hypothetical protein EI293_21710 [Hymenobacter perfusus]